MTGGVDVAVEYVDEAVADLLTTEVGGEDGGHVGVVGEPGDISHRQDCCGGDTDGKTFKPAECVTTTVLLQNKVTVSTSAVPFQSTNSDVLSSPSDA